MSIRASRWVLFGVALLTLPFPMLVFSGELAPAARYLQMAGAMGLVVAIEGASTTVQQIVALFAAHAIVATLACWAGAWIASRLLGGVSARARARIVVVVALIAIGVALSGPVYRTPLGPEPRGNLLEALS